MNIRKSVQYTAIAALSALSLSAFAMQHSSPSGECESPRSHGMAGHHMSGMGHPGMEQHGMALHRLDLSDEQHDKVFELMHGQAKQQHETMRALRKQQGELQQLTRTTPFDAAKARVLANEIGQLKASQLLQHAQTEAQLRALLTPEQLKQLDQRAGDKPRGPRMAPAVRPQQ